MNSSELIRRRQEAANQYKSFWQPRDAGEVTYRNNLKANAAEVRTNYRPTVPSAGSTVVLGGSNESTRAECDVPQGPGNGFTVDLTYTTVQNKDSSCAVCSDYAWGATGGISLLSCASISNITTSSIPLNPVTAGVKWITGANGSDIQVFSGDCPPNNSAQTPHFASNPTCLVTSNVPYSEANVYYGRQIPHSARVPN